MLCTLKTDSGSVVKAIFAVKEIDELVTSHFFNGSSVLVNADYPAELQPRNRESLVLQTQVYKMARNIDPDMLAFSVNLNQGAPVVRADGVVLNGNGRAMAIALAYKQFVDSASGYRQFLCQHATEFGLTAEAVDAFDKPVLVRVIQDTLDDITLDAVIHSTVGGSVLSALETAKADADKLLISDFNDYDINSNGDLTARSNAPFVGKIIYRISSDNERAQYYQPNGALTVDAVNRVKRALFALAFDDDGLLEKMSNATDDGSKNISNALISVAPNFAKLTLQTGTGVFHRYDVASTLSTAVNRYEFVRNSSFPSVEQYFNQNTLFDRESVAVELIMRFFDDNKRNSKWIKEFLLQIINVIKRQGAPIELTLDGIDEIKPLSLDEIIKSAFDFANEAKGGGANLFNDTEAPSIEPTTAVDDAPVSIQAELQNYKDDVDDKNAQAMWQGLTAVMPAIAARFMTDDALLDTLETAAFTLAVSETVDFEPAVFARDAIAQEIAEHRLYLFNQARERIDKGISSAKDDANQNDPEPSEPTTPEEPSIVKGSEPTDEAPSVEVFIEPTTVKGSEHRPLRLVDNHALDPP